MTDPTLGIEDVCLGGIDDQMIAKADPLGDYF